MNSNIDTKMFNDFPDVVSTKELTKMLKVSRSTALNLLQSQTIKSFRIGNIYKIPKKCIVDYINSQI